MLHAFPHDELKPMFGKYTNSMPELGNAVNHNPKYDGIALSLIDSLDSLLMFGHYIDFIFAWNYLTNQFPGFL